MALVQPHVHYPIGHGSISLSLICVIERAGFSKAALLELWDVARGAVAEGGAVLPGIPGGSSFPKCT